MATEGTVPSVREQIPTAEFIEDLGTYMSNEGTPEAVIEKLQRMYSALKFIEQKLTQRKAKLKSKIPEIEATYAAAMLAYLLYLLYSPYVPYAM